MEKIILGIVAVVFLGASGYFFVQNKNISSELKQLKNTDLAKEVESLKQKVVLGEEALALEKEKLADREKKLALAEAREEELEEAIQKTKPTTAVIVAFNNWQYDTERSGLHVLDRDTSKIDAAINALGDDRVASLWKEIKAGFPKAKQTGAFRYEEIIILVTSRLTDLLKL